MLIIGITTIFLTTGYMSKRQYVLSLQKQHFIRIYAITKLSNNVKDRFFFGAHETFRFRGL